MKAESSSACIMQWASQSIASGRCTARKQLHNNIAQQISEAGGRVDYVEVRCHPLLPPCTAHQYPVRITVQQAFLTWHLVADNNLCLISMYIRHCWRLVRKPLHPISSFSSLCILAAGSECTYPGAGRRCKESAHSDSCCCVFWHSTSHRQS